MSVAIVMGVSGCGKTTVAKGIAAQFGWRLLEGDTLHPPANIAKMSAGRPLDDADRAPWLVAIAAQIDAWREDGVSGVVACSALKRAYRDVLIGARQDVALVYLQGSQALIAERMAARKGHFMPFGLLDSQFAALEEPGPDEHPIVCPITGTPEEVIAIAVAKLAARETAG